MLSWGPRTFGQQQGASHDIQEQLEGTRTNPTSYHTLNWVRVTYLIKGLIDNVVG
jgi:hypothetical protein